MLTYRLKIGNVDGDGGTVAGKECAIMATIEEIKRKGSVAFRVRFYRNGKQENVYLDSSYTRFDAEQALRMIETWLTADRHGEPLDRMTRCYFESAPIDLQRRFALCGILEAKRFLTIRDAWSEFFREKSAEVTESTQKIWKRIGDHLTMLYDERRSVSEITERDALESRKRLAEVYSEATVALTIGRLRTFWNWCVKNGVVTQNVYAKVRKGSTSNHLKDFQIPREWTERILEACPSQNWRTLFVLWRVAGLRQQEPLLITWDCVNWEKKRLLVPSPKTSRYEGRENRLVPLFPILERELKASFDEAPVGEPFVVWQNRRQNFDSGFKRILFFAGIAPWKKLFQNMRASAENDLVEDGYPEHVVGAWIGHTPKVQQKHYLRVLDSYFDKATQSPENAEENSVARDENLWHESRHKPALNLVKTR